MIVVEQQSPSTKLRQQSIDLGVLELDDLLLPLVGEAADGRKALLIVKELSSRRSFLTLRLRRDPLCVPDPRAGDVQRMVFAQLSLAARSQDLIV